MAKRIVLDLDLCCGCRSCEAACKVAHKGEAHIRHGDIPGEAYLPLACKHCKDPLCVAACPVDAIKRDEETGLVTRSSFICIGCKSCMLADPYGVIHFNKKTGFIEWGSDDSTIVKGGTTSKKELAQISNAPFPYFNVERGADGYEAIRGKGAVEKCTFCNHRVKKGMMPHCVVACPSDARIFGDLDDSNSNINQLLNEYKAEVLMPEKGTKPKVFYIRSYN